MLTKIPCERTYCFDTGSYVERFHFPFGDYQDPANSSFGVLNALNDFYIQPGAGFPSHSHEEMEIISYCVEGELTHMDGIHNRHVLGRGDVQYVCAGSGIVHSEMNKSAGAYLRFLQIWITPANDQLEPKYRSKRYPEKGRRNRLLHIASGEKIDDVIHIAQDANIYVSEIDKGKRVDFSNEAARQSYLLCLEGEINVNGFNLAGQDAMKVPEKNDLQLNAVKDSHLLVIEMAAD
jgi:redox-sensitive bicupin YhaK (pirin superfamily)